MIRETPKEEDEDDQVDLLLLSGGRIFEYIYTAKAFAHFLFVKFQVNIVIEFPDTW